MKYGSIEFELALCKKAFKDSKIGDLVWFCHHDMPIEILTEPGENRINFILKHKEESEKAIRLHWFRPCIVKLSKRMQRSYADWQRSYADWQKAYADWQKAKADWQRVIADWADIDRQKAIYDWQKVYAEAEYGKEINALVKKHLPNCPWDGEILFLEEKP